MGERSRFVCQGCGFATTRWLGKCPDCQSWNTLVEERSSPPAPAGRGARDAGVAASPPTALDEIPLTDAPRDSSGSEEFDRVLGGGIVPGSVVLIGGDPGIGKTTLLLETLGRLSGGRGTRVLYCSGEESLRQIRLRADRLGIRSRDLVVFAETSLESILAEVRRLSPGILAVDSIQTVGTSALESVAGSIGQVREVAATLIALAKRREITVFLVGHVTKDGGLAGPKVLEHLVDTVLYFEGEPSGDYRILRAVKNRFGSTNEIGVFEMGDGGLREVANPSRAFLPRGHADLAGSVVTAAVEGTRPFLVEVQALCARAAAGSPRRVCSGADPARLAMIIAILERKAGLLLSDQDVYLNLVGGIKAWEPAVDLGIFLAVASAFRNKPVRGDTVFFGEIGLTGEIRGVRFPETRVKEAKKLGFQRCVMPGGNLSLSGMDLDHFSVAGVSHVDEAFEHAFLQ